ncbi:hypothetical protein [Tautonia plasticadhaerens]|uniref:Uncharacterized protein n=1 Tax=Tautonia plasticadhaerens TaxID=2527974 RepID=A0A518H2X7_9BACT|nr:hypothetical protein [Tautonia plasticadhaerens]QDV35188.1 hypothetical protein ElP_30910 [Tautonia plasticadhaerens]
MRRSEAARRHRRAVAVVAAMAGVIVVLLAAVAPWAEEQYLDRGIEPSANALLVFRAGHAVAEHPGIALLLAAALIGLLWSSYGLLDRPARSRS